jgi:hypothetical protein
LIYFIIGFILGNIAQRIFLARINTKRADWMRSIKWSNNKYYHYIHDKVCEICPKRWYCDRYKGKFKGRLNENI